MEGGDSHWRMGVGSWGADASVGEEPVESHAEAGLLIASKSNHYLSLAV